jgi:CO dehydrogenase nickel-insertion accessory protein CooC1
MVGGLSLGNKQQVMAFTNKPSIALTLDQVMEIVDQLSPADTLKVAKHIKKKNKDADLDDLIAIFSKVKMSEKEVTTLVEEVRTERYASQKARSARR